MDQQIGGTGGVADERLRERAYEISLGEDAGTPEENWRRAEQELRADTSRSSDGDDETPELSTDGAPRADAAQADAAPAAGDQPSEDLPGAASP